MDCRIELHFGRPKNLLSGNVRFRALKSAPSSAQTRRRPSQRKRLVTEAVLGIGEPFLAL